MSKFAYKLCLYSTMALSTLSLIGCVGVVVNPDTNVDFTTELGSIQGSNYGGHAPIVGAHVFVLQPDPLATGYGQMAKSLIVGSGSAAFPTAVDLRQNSPTYGMEYVTTDASGQFNVTGDYSCNTGYPVYLYASGGNPNAPTAVQVVVNVTAATITGTGPYIIKFIASNLLYQGESIAFAGSGSSLASYLNGQTQTVLANADLSTGTFDISVNSLTANGVTLTTGLQATGTLQATQAASPPNPAIANMAVLGLCGDAGAHNFTSLNFVYMNEVSTVAAAYALAGFFDTTASTFTFSTNSLTSNGVTLSPGPQASMGNLTANGSSGFLTITGASVSGSSAPYTVTLTATGVVSSGESLTFSGSGGSVGTYLNNGMYSVLQQSGNDAVHISVPSGDSLAFQGLGIAGRTAAQLYDIQGSNIGSNATGANCATTPSSPICNGEAHIARTQTTYSAPTGVVPQALIDTLGNVLANCVDSSNTFNAATVPTGVSSTQCSTLFGAAKSGGTSGTVPNDIAAAAINIAHNPWANVPTIYNLPTGNIPFIPGLASVPNDFGLGISYTWLGIQHPESIAVDGYGAVWITQDSSTTVASIQPLVSPPGSALLLQQVSVNYGFADISVRPDSGHNGVASSLVVAYDGASYIYLISYVPSVPPLYGITKYTSSLMTAVIPATEPLSGSQLCLGSFVPNHLAVDSAANGYNLWISSEDGDTVCKVDTISTGNLIWKTTINSAQGSGSYSPEVIAIDAFGNAWVPNQKSSTLNKISQAGTLSSVTGGSLSNPYGVAIDGIGRAFVANRGNNGITEYANSGVAVTPTNLQAGGVLNDPMNIAVDLSGNIWTTNYTGNRIVEVVGAAAPTYAPVSAAGAMNRLGSKP